jgi:Flp pilus assembly pilin Flp
MDEKIAEVEALRRQVYAMRDRVHRLEIGLFRTVVALGSAAVVSGFFVPFLSATEKADAGEDDSISLLPTVFGIGDTGGGPFSGEAALAAVVVGVFALAILVALVALLRLFRDRVSARAVRFARICGIVLLVMCAFGWLLVFALAGHWDGRVSAFSPATLCFTVGGAAALAAAALHPADWRD